MFFLVKRYFGFHSWESLQNSSSLTAFVFSWVNWGPEKRSASTKVLKLCGGRPSNRDPVPSLVPVLPVKSCDVAETFIQMERLSPWSQLHGTAFSLIETRHPSFGSEANTPHTASDPFPQVRKLTTHIVARVPVLQSKGGVVHDKLLQKGFRLSVSGGSFPPTPTC